MKHSKYLFIISLLFSIILFTNCKKAVVNFGEQFLGDGLTDIVKVDSFSSSLSTVYLDSFPTSNRGVIMLGGYNDAFLGRIETKSFMQFNKPSWTATNQRTYYDSIQLILKTNGTYYGDSTKLLNITVNELKDSLIFYEGQFVMFNNRSFEVKPIILANENLIVTPTSNQTIKINLPKSFGDTLFRKLTTTNDNDFRTSETFLNYFRGLQISSNSNSQMIANFSDDAIIRIYYRQDGATAQNKSIDFPVTNKTKLFNNISINRAGTSLSGINSNNKVISASETNNVAFCQRSTNTAIKLSFPSIRNVVKMPNYAKVLKAALIIKPLPGSFDRIFNLPPALKISKTDITNKPLEDLVFVNSNGGFSIQTGLLNVDYIRNENTQYSYDVTQYVKDIILTNSGVAGEGILLIPPSPNAENTFNRLILPNNQRIVGSIKLEIYFATVK